MIGKIPNPKSQISNLKIENPKSKIPAPAQRPWLLSEINYGYVKEHPYEVAVLPMGATEPHNLHLPYGTDTIEGEGVAGRACELAWQRGARVVRSACA